MGAAVKGVNLQWGQTPPSCIPIIAIISNDWMTPAHLHDWLDDVEVAAYRLMAGITNVQQLVPAGHHVIPFNENDDDRSQRTAWVLALKAMGYIVHYGAECWNEWHKYDPQLVTMCDYVDFHVNSDAQAPDVVGASYLGKPTWITEAETNPNNPQWGRLARFMQDTPRTAFAWGASQQQADVNRQPVVLDAIRQANGVYSVAEPEQTQDQKITQEADQNMHIGEALYALTKIVSAFPSCQPGQVFADEAFTARAHVAALNEEKYRF
ncbi:MAG: hypothetical protein KGJ86_00195 [Chloroflexota bacterium]|nr:hypothetical protein [Chloroflexota bacterium]